MGTDWQAEYQTALDAWNDEIGMRKAAEVALTEVGDAEWNAAVEACFCPVCDGSGRSSHSATAGFCHQCGGTGTQEGEAIRRLKRSKP